MKYIIIQILGKQLILKPGEWYDINYIPYNNKFIKINKILLYRNKNNIQIGKPFLKNSFVIAKIYQHINAPKIIILKTKPKKNYTRLKKHKQIYTRIYINKI